MQTPTKVEQPRNATFADNIKSLGHDLYTGLAGVSNSLWHFADWVIPDEAVSQIFGAENKVGQFFDKQYATYDAIQQKNKELGQKADKAVEAVGDYVVQPVAAAVPQAVIALMSGGTSLAGQGASALGTAAASGGSTAAAVGAGVKNMMSNPSFWMSFAQTAGNTYDEAKESGASELEAQAATLLNAFAGSTIEMGGGIQTLPGTDMGLRSWIRSTLEEGGEEYLQGIMEQLVTKAVYDQDMEWASWTDPDAVFSGSRALQEILGGITVGGIVGGGQIAAGKAMQKVSDYSFAVKAGNQYINGQNGHNIDEAIAIGLSNAKGTDTYRVAETLAKKVQNGERVSPYAVGRMVLESYSPKAEQARQIDRTVRESAAQYGVAEETADTVAQVAAALSRKVQFVPQASLAVTNDAGVVSYGKGKYIPGSDTVLLSSDATADEATDTLLKHELAHAIEGTPEADRLAAYIRRSKGDRTWKADVSAMQAERAQRGDRYGATAEGAAHEVVADWIAENLYAGNFAQLVASGDAKTGNAIVRVLDRMRLALGGTQKNRRASQIAAAERLFVRALENKGASNASGDSDVTVYFIPKSENDIGIKEQLREHLGEINAMEPVADIYYDHVDRLTARKAVSEEFKRLGYKVDRQGFGVIEIGEKEIGVSADYVKTPAECAAWLAVPKVLKRGKLIFARDNHKARGHDTITIAAPVVINGTPGILGVLVKETGKNHYKSHRILMPDGSAFIYEDAKNAEPRSIGMTDHKDGEGPTNGSASNTTVSQNSLGVNTQSMQNGTENAPYSFAPVENPVLQSTAEAGDVITPSAIHEEAVRRAADAPAAQRAVAQGRSMEELAQELGDAELDRRMYMAMNKDLLPDTVTVDGQELDTTAYMAAVEEMLPDDRAGLEAFISRAEAQLAQDMETAYANGETESVGSLPVNIQLFAAKRKLEMLLEPGEEGSETRRFFWQRTRGLDANKAHEQELLDYLAGRSETYDPISNQTTLDKAKRKLEDRGYEDRLVKRLGRYNPKDRFTEVEMAAAMVLINKARNDGNLELYADLVQGLSRKGTDAGRAVQILSIMARMTPEGTLRAAERTFRQEVDRVHGEGTSEAIDDLSGAVVDAVERAAEENGRTLPNFEEDAEFSQHIDQWETLNSYGYINVGRIPGGHPLHQVGIPAGKLYFDVSKLKQAMADHGDHLSPDILKKIPELLKNPIAIVEYKPGEGTNTVNIYGDLYYHGTPITVGIVVTLSPGGTVISKVRTVHARRDFFKQITDDSILYLGENKNETDTWFQTQGQPVPMSGTKYGFIRSIAHPFGHVKPTLTREELVDGLVENIRQDGSPYITEEQIRGIIERAVDNATNIPAQMKKLLRSDDVKDALAKKIETVYKAGHLNDVTMRQAFEEALDLPRLSDGDVQTLIGLVNKMQATEDGSAEQAQAMEDIYKFLGEKLEVTWLEKLQAWRKFAMLANPKTHARNVISNAAMHLGINRLDTAFATMLQRWFVDPAVRTAYLGWRHTEQGRQLLSLPALQKSAEEAVVKMQTDGGKYDITTSRLTKHKKYFGRNKAGEWLNKQNAKNSDALEWEDALTFRPAYIDALGQIMVARGMTEITKDVEDVAYRRALEATFRANNAINDVLVSLKRYANSDKMGSRLFGHAVDVVIPFSKTPANIAKQTVLHSPVGIAKAAWDLAHAKGDARAKATALNTMAKGMTGTALWAIGILLGSLGVFNTGFGKTEKERAADELAGIQENSFQFGDVSITLDWLQPAAAPLIVGASMAQRLKEDGISLGSVFGAVMDGTDSLFELSMLQSLYDVLGGYDAGASATAASVAENVISQSIPTLLGQAARIVDPVARKTTGDNDFETIVNQVVSKIPGLTYLLDPKLDVWGNEVYRTGKASAGSAALNFFQQLILPWNTKIATGDDEISRMVLALYENADDRPSRAIPSTADRDMAAELGMDYTELRKLVGKVNRQAVEDLMADRVAYTVQVETPTGKKRSVNKTWSNMTEQERLTVLNRIYTKTKQQVEEPDNKYFEDLMRRVQNGN